jgi:hypothetical protein
MIEWSEFAADGRKLDRANGEVCPCGNPPDAHVHVWRVHCPYCTIVSTTGWPYPEGPGFYQLPEHEDIFTHRWGGGNFITANALRNPQQGYSTCPGSGLTVPAEFVVEHLIGDRDG